MGEMQTLIAFYVMNDYIFLFAVCKAMQYGKNLNQYIPKSFHFVHTKKPPIPLNSNFGYC